MKQLNNEELLELIKTAVEKFKLGLLWVIMIITMVNLLTLIILTTLIFFRG